MARAARGEAAGGQIVNRGRRTTDLATLRRVRAALLADLGGTMPATPSEPETSRAVLERRTLTPLKPLRHIRGAVQ